MNSITAPIGDLLFLIAVMIIAVFTVLRSHRDTLEPVACRLFILAWPAGLLLAFTHGVLSGLLFCYAMLVVGLPVYLARVRPSLRVHAIARSARETGASAATRTPAMLSRGRSAGAPPFGPGR